VSVIAVTNDLSDTVEITDEMLVIIEIILRAAPVLVNIKQQSFPNRLSNFTSIDLLTSERNQERYCGVSQTELSTVVSVDSPNPLWTGYSPSINR